MPSEVTFHHNLDVVDWHELKATLSSDRFDNGRSRFQCLRHGERQDMQHFIVSQFEQLCEDGNGLIVVAIGPHQFSSVWVQPKKFEDVFALFPKGLMGLLLHNRGLYLRLLCPL